MAGDSKDRVLAAGQRLDGYELLLPVGEGGMASVWVARLSRKHGFEKLVAIKTILPKFAEDETFQKMFLDEARIASRIDHTNVAHIHDLGETDGILYIVMEYVDGDALTRLRKVLFKKGVSFPVGVALRVMADVCAGLHAAHDLKGLDGKALGVVHRDVSPQNVLITADGVSKLIDFGVAKAEQRLTDETHTGFVKGKVQYMAPEQALGKNVDRRADVWAVGAVLYHLIAGKPPFEADNQLALLALLQRGKPAPNLPPNVPVAVNDVVKKALTHNLLQRFQSAMEMKIAIEKTGLAATPEEVGACMREHLGEFAERRKRSLGLALQQVDAASSSRQVSNPDLVAPSVSTQRIAPEDLPKVMTGRTPPQAFQPPSESRLGPPTPQSFPVMAAAVPYAEDPRRMTAPLGAGALPPLGPLVKQTLVQTGAPSMTPNPRQRSSATFGTSSQTGPQPQTEPLPSVEAIEAAAAENTNGGGSLGLASVSTSMPVKTGGVSWMVIGALSFMCVLAAVGIGLGVRSVGQKRFDPQFSTMPSAASPLPSASAAPATTPTAAPTPAPTPSDAASTEPVTSAHPAGAHPPPVAPPTNAGVRPTPTGSGKKRPKVDDGF